MTSLFTQDEPTVAYARVAVERGVDRYPDGLTYAIPEALVDLRVGERVEVPLGRGNRAAAGYVIEIRDRSDLAGEIKPITARAAPAARLPVELLQLARWIGAYYCAPIGMTLASMVPAAAKRNIGAVTRTFVDLAEPDAAEPGGSRLSPQQRRVLELLTERPQQQRPVEMKWLAEAAGLRSVEPIRRLIRRGALRPTSRSGIEAAWAEHAADATAPARLTDPQAHVVDRIGPTLDDGFAVHLLHGVTGSGKTEVYIRLIERCLERRRTALLLVPEISLTPQTGGRLIGRFAGRRVAVLHSGLTAAQRHQQWATVAEGSADIVLGARSAVFAPIPDGRLGLVVVDEEHDSSYKQDQVPRYHGRDVAIRRAQIAGCPAVLGSATPSLESWHNATRGLYGLHRLAERVPGASLPRVRVVDFIEQQRAHHDRAVHLIGPVLAGAIESALARDRQVLLLLNRRGFANYIACPDHRCGWLLCCDDCDVTMVHHLQRSLPTGGYVQCHHCGAEQRLPGTCPDCGRRVTSFGLGTQRVEVELARRFPQLVEGETMLRIDSDTMQTARHFHDALERFGRGELRLLLGTQLIAKGLDYPGVSVVGVVNADTAINMPDFRATERTFQLVSQVAGRCGRGSDPGLVIVQTFNPSVPAITLAAAHDYEGFATRELEDRRRCGLPPIGRLTRIVVRDAELQKCEQLADRLAAQLHGLVEREGLAGSVEVRGPAPCPIARIAGRHRQQVEVLADDGVTMQRLLVAARNADAIRSDAVMAVDVDPVALL